VKRYKAKVIQPPAPAETPPVEEPPGEVVEEVNLGESDVNLGESEVDPPDETRRGRLLGALQEKLNVDDDDDADDDDKKPYVSSDGVKLAPKRFDLPDDEPLGFYGLANPTALAIEKAISVADDFDGNPRDRERTEPQKRGLLFAPGGKSKEQIQAGVDRIKGLIDTFDSDNDFGALEKRKQIYDDQLRHLNNAEGPAYASANTSSGAPGVLRPIPRNELGSDQLKIYQLIPGAIEGVDDKTVTVNLYVIRKLRERLAEEAKPIQDKYDRLKHQRDSLEMSKAMYQKIMNRMGQTN
jgi:hypothetical protein